MLTPDNNFAVKSNDFIAGARDRHYDRIITELSNRQSTSITLFAEATTQVTRLTESPVSILSLVSDRGCQIGSIGGLELLDKLPKNANLLLELAGIEYCHHQTMICDRSFIIGNFQEYPELNTTSLVRVHGIQSYMGVPIITASGDRLGVISSLDFTPHPLSDSPEERLLQGQMLRYRQRDIDLLQLVSRWLASEFERKFLSQAQLNQRIGDFHDSMNPILSEQKKQGFDDTPGERLLVQSGVVCKASVFPEIRQQVVITEHIQNIEEDGFKPVSISKKISTKRDLSLNYPQIKTEIQFKLIVHLAQKLRTPLTSVLGMASVLQQEIYGPLTSKQKDYLGIIHNSGQQSISIVDEIAQLVAVDAEGSALANRKQHQLNLESVDLEILCQLAIQNLEPLLQQKQQQMVLDLSEGNRLWLVDKDNVRQIIYYLSLSLIQGSATRHQISILLQRHSGKELANLSDRLQLQITTTDPQPTLLDRFTNQRRSVSSSSPSVENEMGQDLRISLGLSLSYTLASLHGGNIELMPHRRGYLLSIPTTSKAAAV
jgi:signal transduction histidine kinase